MGAGGVSPQSRGVALSLTTGGSSRAAATTARANPRRRASAPRAAGTSGAAAAAGTKPGAAISYMKGDTLRVIARLLKPGETLSQEVGRVMEGALITGHSIPPPPPETKKEGTVFGWFVEDLERPGTWEPYAKESADRLEDAFLNMRGTCTVVMKKRSYTVDLHTMQQLPAASAGAASTYPAQQQQRTREVKRVPVVTYTDPNTGEVKVQEALLKMVDPFMDEEEDNDNGQPQQIAEGAGDVIGAGADGAAVAAELEAGHLPHLIRTVVPHSSPIYTMECTPDVQQLCPEARAVVDPAGGALVLSSGRDRQLLEWSIETSTVITRYEVPGTTSKNSVLTANYSCTAKWMVAGLDDCTARLYAIGNPSEVYRLEGHTHKVYGAGVLVGDAQAATASMDCHVKLWDIATGVCVRSTVPHKSHIFALRPHPTDPNVALTAGEDCKVCLHDFRRGNSVAAVFTGPDRTIWDVDWNPANITFAACGMDCTTRIFDPRVSTTAVKMLRSHSRAVHSIKYTPQGRGVLSCSKDSFVSLADTTNWSVQWQAKAHTTTVFRVRYHAGKSVMVTAGSDSSVNVWSWGELTQL
ncbi:WWE domain/WD domain G-beta repeat [Leishmania donovani]|uniref:WD domain, G-beta repeat family protein n=1 Tax=Leishmania donovani TaxID=5661 RepID=A0A504XXZ7_LEIDO|nr:hypothetical protein, conserved [Leishmania donovani]TPP41174.1 WD domain, G-beta repeat family protein [Leishmania donovani]TPP52018.1 WD domain, G-beta repeat family protein [Leishmania donovani]CAJ1989726.1 WWE domain/WD domain G-beta repeat [Leishmania donovani]CBZ35026.1 hypothetical protein, conserved [Leishmania donovani]VDZ45591.1 WWE_domain/WD_domain_G-beta_repeat_putative/Pfam:PF02825/Pfam:PF00400 [Leishmania donovani]